MGCRWCCHMTMMNTSDSSTLKNKMNTRMHTGGKKTIDKVHFGIEILKRRKCFYVVVRNSVGFLILLFLGYETLIRYVGWWQDLVTCYDSFINGPACHHFLTMKSIAHLMSVSISSHEWQTSEFLIITSHHGRVNQWRILFKFRLPIRFLK